MRTCALSVAGSDPTGGAGLQADIKTFEALGVHGAGVVTALTAQNTSRVFEVRPVGADILRAQLDAVLSELEVAAAKTGMLPTAEAVRVAARMLRGVPTVADPVMRAGSGAALQDEDAPRALLRFLVPAAVLVTPNIPELSALTGLQIRRVREALRAGRRLMRMGAKAVLVKGGHLRGSTVRDLLLLRGGRVRVFSRARFRTAGVHGTGCVLASAVAARLAQGDGMEEAAAFAEDYIGRVIRHSSDMGGAQRIPHPLAGLENEAGRFALLERVRHQVGRLVREPRFESLIPEVGSNLAAGLACAETAWDVAAVPGRIRRGAPARSPWFGVSDHVARLLLGLRAAGKGCGAVLNVRSTTETLRACRRAGLRVASVDRRREPASRRRREKTTLGWMAGRIGGGALPDALADEGDWGKEPMIRILGRSPEDVVRKTLRVARAMGKGGRGA